MKFLFSFFVMSFISSSISAQPQEVIDSLQAELELLFMKDQTFRRIYTEAENKLGKDSDAYAYFWEVVEANDVILEEQVVEIIEMYGWLGTSQIGRRANTAIWAVLQHGSHESKMKYAPLMKASVLQGESQASQYADLIDWMLINTNQPQVYGSGINYNTDGYPVFHPVENPTTINSRRKEIGLGSIEEYANRLSVQWNYK